MKMVLASLDIDHSGIYNPNYFPLGLLYIAEIAKSQNIDTLLFDINEFIYDEINTIKFERTTLVKKILSNSPDCISFYTRSDILPFVILCSNDIKKMDPNIKIILGGPGVYSVEKEIIENFQFIDIIVRGEGDETVKDLFKGGELNNCLKKIDGICYKDSSVITITPDRAPISNLDMTVIPTRIVNSTNIKGYVPIEAGRGCPYNCSFCSTSIYWNRKYRVKSPKRLVREMEILSEHLKYNKFTFSHDNLTVSEDYIIELAQEIKNSKFDFVWGCCSRIDNINENMIRLMKESGCCEIYFGIETGSLKMQHIIGKNLNIDNIYENLKLCEKYKIRTTKSFIIGFREENYDDVNETLKLAIKTGAYKYGHNIQLSYLQPNPGTKVTIECFDSLILDENRIPYVLDGVSRRLWGKSVEKLIEKYPIIFSSYYKISDGAIFDKQKIVYCFSHLLLYYIKTLNILCFKYNIKPLELYSYIKANCCCINTCMLKSKEETMGGNGVCSKFNDFVSKIISITNLEKQIIDFETHKRNYMINVLEDQFSVLTNRYVEGNCD